MTTTPTPRLPVMEDVASLAGVSHQTVSRVLNAHPNVTARTRARVERAIAELGYRPNTAPAFLSRGSPKLSESCSLPWASAPVNA